MMGLTFFLFTLYLLALSCNKEVFLDFLNQSFMKTRVVKFTAWPFFTSLP